MDELPRERWWQEKRTEPVTDTIGTPLSRIAWMNRLVQTGRPEGRRTGRPREDRIS